MTSIDENLQATTRRFKALYTAAVYDILEELGQPAQCLDIGIKPLDPDAVIAGPAFTLGYSFDVRTDDEFTDAEINTFAYFNRIPAGSVVVVSGPKSQCGYWGELMSTAAKARGAQGVIVDGAMRDGKLVKKISDWTAFCRDLTPIESKGRIRLHIINEPVGVTGSLGLQVRVAPGDWVIGDMDGVVVVPAHLVDEVLTRAESVSEVETAAREEIRNGAPVNEVFAKYGRL
jgi:4-hydroxy-4-methyl-2-oxoglutarate aldolase